MKTSVSKEYSLERGVLTPAHLLTLTSVSALRTVGAV